MAAQRVCYMRVIYMRGARAARVAAFLKSITGGAARAARAVKSALWRQARKRTDPLDQNTGTAPMFSFKMQLHMQSVEGTAMPPSDEIELHHFQITQTCRLSSPVQRKFLEIFYEIEILLFKVYIYLLCQRLNHK